jgi:hypothetical protein
MDGCRNCDGQNESMWECEKQSPQNGVTFASLKEKAKLLRCGSLSLLNWWIQYIIYLVVLYMVVDWCDVHDSLHSYFIFITLYCTILCLWFYAHDFMSYYNLPWQRKLAEFYVHEWKPFFLLVWNKGRKTKNILQCSDQIMMKHDLKQASP